VFGENGYPFWVFCVFAVRRQHGRNRIGDFSPDVRHWRKPTSDIILPNSHASRAEPVDLDTNDLFGQIQNGALTR
jgi:hypothetical protein